ncbi:Clp protease N-terminal domain-containing protein [Massilia sp. MB5]|uniref:Clp protease N-terminal domain-containing protein n=1 Tax=Massilia sp. MB5 TaxID=2919578 RepID=UPI001F0CEB69|nr:Clp protease N-terminal domain-containing protein [Massilia sp. MB5]UMR31281.1 Clp protease N-terminal domain-containing protein [Massilia sp. MB5]
MFDRIKQRLRDMGTIKRLCEDAEKHANADGQAQAGAEHFILAALDLPDGTARQAMQRLNVAPEQYRTAIARQHQEAMQFAGVAALPEEVQQDAALPPAGGLYRAQASAQTLIQQLSERQKEENGALPLLGAHVLLAASAAQYGTAVRVWRLLGVEPAALAEAARGEIRAFRPA